MPDRDALNETLQRLAAVLYSGDTPAGSRNGERPEGLESPGPIGSSARPDPAGEGGNLVELPPGVPVSGNFLCPGDPHRPLAIHFEEGAVHVVVSADRPDGAAETPARRAAEEDPALRLRIEILLGPSR